jgi:hypothetical protein
MGSERLQHSMKLADKMIESWSREELMIFAWDRLADELILLNNSAYESICNQYDIPYKSE